MGNQGATRIKKRGGKTRKTGTQERQKRNKEEEEEEETTMRRRGTVSPFFVCFVLCFLFPFVLQMSSHKCASYLPAWIA
jgi:hypothetical protein